MKTKPVDKCVGWKLSRVQAHSLNLIVTALLVAGSSWFTTEVSDSKVAAVQIAQESAVETQTVQRVQWQAKMQAQIDAQKEELCALRERLAALEGRAQSTPSWPPQWGGPYVDPMPMPAPTIPDWSWGWTNISPQLWVTSGYWYVNCNIENASKP